MIFYTLPPLDVSYPYVLINANRPELGLMYLRRHSGNVSMVIVDSGVEVFRDPEFREYPGGAMHWMTRLIRLYYKARSIARGANVYVTVNDYPDDYHPKSLWLGDHKTNIERTVANVEVAVNKYTDVKWLIPVQGWSRRPESLVRSLEYYLRMGVLERYDYLAVANLCVEPDVKIIHASLDVVNKWLESHGFVKRIHVFGLKINVLRSLKREIYSFDSFAWTKPVSGRLHDMYPYSAKNSQQRRLFFCEYIRRLARKYRVKIPTHTLEACRDTVIPHDEKQQSLPL